MTSEAITVALLLPETKTARYETQDRPLFEAKVKELCDSCEIVYSNADQDAAKQKQQAEAALRQAEERLLVAFRSLRSPEQLPLVDFVEAMTDRA